MSAAAFAADDPGDHDARIAEIVALLQLGKAQEARDRARFLLAEIEASGVTDEPTLLARAHAHYLAGYASWLLSEGEVAERHYRDALAIYREIGDRQGEANALDGLGDVLRGRDEGEAAERHYRDALAIYREIGDRQGEANALRGLGHVLRGRGEGEAAERHYRDALAIYREIGDRQGEANALLGLGHVLRGRGEGEAAERHYRDALAIYREIGDRQGEANALLGLGHVLRGRGEGEAAERHYRDALAIYREIGDRQGEANALDGLGDVLRGRGEGEAAERHYRDALATYREIGARLGEANALLGLGDVLRGRDEGETAERHYRDALAIYREIGDRQGEANALDGLGDVLRGRDEGEAAERHYRDALATYREIGDRQGEANALLGLGHVLRGRGEGEAAERHYRDALAIYREIGVRLGQANALLGLGHVLRGRGEGEAAERHYRDALAIYREIGDRQGEANALDGLGDVLRGRGEREEAERHYRDALATYREIGARLGQANALDGLGDVLRGRGEGEAAERHYRDALAIYREIGDRLGQANALLGLGHVLRGRGEGEAAERHYRDALAIYREIGDRLGQANACVGLAILGVDPRVSLEEAVRLYREARDPNEAFALALYVRLDLESDGKAAWRRLRRALQVIERVGSTFTTPESRIAHNLRWEDVFQIAILNRLIESQTHAAFTIHARYQGRLLAELGARGPAGARSLDAHPDPHLRHDYNAVEERIDQLEAEYHAVFLDRLAELAASLPRDSLEAELAVRASPPLVELTRQLDEAQRERLLLLHRADVTAPQAESPEVPVDVTYRALRDAVTAQGIALVSFAWSEYLHGAFILLPRRPVRFISFADEAVNRIEERLAELRQVAFPRRDDQGHILRPDLVADPGYWNDCVRSLHERLWSPTIAAMAGDRPVRVVPDRPLAIVPFEALHGTGNVRLLPGPAYLTVEPRPLDTGVEMLALGANPGDLPGTEADLEAVRATFGSAAQVHGTDKDPAGTLLRATGTYRYLFTTSHVQDATDRLPGIRLSKPRGDGHVPRLVAVAELFHLQARFEGVIVSGCSGLVPDGGPDLLSVGAALLAATGARLVVSTLWPVSDIGATLLALELLPRLRNGEPLEQALTASLEALRSLTLASRDGYLAGVGSLLPPERLDWVRGQLAGLAGGLHPQVPLLPPGDLLAWTTLGR